MGFAQRLRPAGPIQHKKCTLWRRGPPPKSLEPALGARPKPRVGLPQAKSGWDKKEVSALKKKPQPAPPRRSSGAKARVQQSGGDKKPASDKGRAKRKGAPKGGLTKDERRAQILVAARDVFAKRGYARATVDDIVREAGVARGTYYLYFEDKRGALEALIDRFAVQIGASIIRIITDDPGKTVADQVLANIRGVLAACLEERAMTKILFTDAVGVDHQFQTKLVTFYDGVVHLLTESLRDGQELGVVSDGEPRVLAYLTIGALKELLYQAVTLGLSGESAEALTKQLYAFLCAGYLRVDPQAGEVR